MSVGVSASIAPDASNHSQAFFLARQPIVNRAQSLVAYELLFRNAATDTTSSAMGRAATATVISHAIELGLSNVVGSSLAFLNVDQRTIMADFISLLPANKVVLEVMDSVRVTPELARRMSGMIEAGYTFALDDVVSLTEDQRRLLPMASIVKIDLAQIAISDLAPLVAELKQHGKKLLAKKVETHDQFQTCFNLGFDYFQGYYFARPRLLSGTRLQPLQITIVQLLRQLIEDVEDAAIVHIIKQDVSLSLTLLRMANTPIFGLATRVDSLRQALLLLGRRELQRWLQILLYAGAGRVSGGISPLLALATTRGKLLELIAQKCWSNDIKAADIAFTVGIMSPLDALFDLPMSQVLDQIAVGDDVAEALLQHQGQYGDLLTLIERCEQDRCPEVLHILENLNLSFDDLRLMQQYAYQWSNEVMSVTR